MLKANSVCGNLWTESTISSTLKISDQNNKDEDTQPNDLYNRDIRTLNNTFQTNEKKMKCLFKIYNYFIQF